MQRSIREHEGQHIENVTEGDLLEKDVIGGSGRIRIQVPANYTADT